MKSKPEKRKMGQKIGELFENKTLEIVLFCFVVGGIFTFTSISTYNGEIFPKKDYAAISLAVVFLLATYVSINLFKDNIDNGLLSIVMILVASIVVWKNVYGFIPEYVWRKNLKPAVKKSKIIETDIYKKRGINCEKMILIESIEIPFDGSICIDSNLKINIGDTVMLIGDENLLAFYAERISVIKNTQYGAKKK